MPCSLPRRTPPCLWGLRHTCCARCAGCLRQLRQPRQNWTLSEPSRARRQSPPEAAVRALSLRNFALRAKRGPQKKISPRAAKEAASRQSRCGVCAAALLLELLSALVCASMRPLVRPFLLACGALTPGARPACFFVVEIRKPLLPICNGIALQQRKQIGYPVSREGIQWPVGFALGFGPFCGFSVGLVLALLQLPS